MCLNMWQGGNFFDAVIEFIRKENPDIIVLQEVYNGHNPTWERNYRSIDTMKENFDYPYFDFAPAFLDKTDFADIEQGNATFSRFPILDSDITFYDEPYRPRRGDVPEERETTPRNLQRVAVQLPDKVLNVFNTQGIWGEDGNDNPRRLEMGDIIAGKIKDKENVILAGDFNVLEDTQTIAKIEQHLTNIFKNTLTTSFNMRVKTDGGYGTAVVDMIFVSPHLKILRRECPDIDVSDHLPLVVELEV
jgi:endonuclease/exonuclease/phosphatase family metal-dependent hydrolase